jgi:Protein of unknown function (DUF3383)
MSIDITKYVRITSGVGGGAAVAQRQLIGRLITKSSYVSPNEIYEASSAAEVLAKFNNDVASNEYRRAQAYFKFVNKNIKSPPKISFVRWDTTTFRPPVFTGNSSPKTSTSLDLIKAMNALAGIQITYGGAAAVTARYDGRPASTFLDLAPILQDAIRLAGASITTLALATVTYNVSSNRFIITGSEGTTAGSIVITAAASNDTAQILGFLSGDFSSTAGRVGDNAVQTMDRTSNMSDNFGTFAFVDALDDWQSTTVGSRPQDIAAWNSALNNKFLFSHYVTQAQATQAWYATFIGYPGCGFTLTQDNNSLPSIDSEVFQAQSPMEIMAATDYNSKNGTQNYMFYQFDDRSFGVDSFGRKAARPGAVDDTQTSDALDGIRVNYQGVTMTAGQQIAFYQRGVLMGGSTAATDMNTYANEMWLKDAFLASIMSMLLNVKVSANEVGQGMLLLNMQSVIDTALINGAVSVGKPLNATQKAYIGQITGSDTAWHQVQTSGYWINATLSSSVNPQSGLSEWQFNYTLVYSKDDVVRRVVGSDILI